MRDKVLCRGWARTGKPMTEEQTFLCEGSYFLKVQSSSTPPLSHSVPVSVREGEKMSIDEVLSFFDHNAALKDQKAQREFLEQASRKNLDTIFVAESLFRGTVVDFGTANLSSGGGSYANCGFAIN